MNVMEQIKDLLIQLKDDYRKIIELERYNIDDTIVVATPCRLNALIEK